MEFSDQPPVHWGKSRRYFLQPRQSTEVPQTLIACTSNFVYAKLPGVTGPVVVPGNGISSTRMTAACMHALKVRGIKTHFLKALQGTPVFICEQLRMPPIELVFRIVASRNYAQYTAGVTEGELLTEPALECYYKQNNDRGDLLMQFHEDRVILFNPKTRVIEQQFDSLDQVPGFGDYVESDLKRLRPGLVSLGQSVVPVLREFLGSCGYFLRDGKIEVGFNHNNELCVGDAFDLESCRLSLNDQYGEQVSKESCIAIAGTDSQSVEQIFASAFGTRHVDIADKLHKAAKRWK